MKRGRSRCCLHVCLISLKWASWSEVRNLLKAAAHPQSLCLDVQELFGSYHHHTHGQGRPRSPIRQRQCNYNCLQNTRQRLLPVLDIPRAALATTSDATKIKANFNRRWMSNRPIPQSISHIRCHKTPTTTSYCNTVMENFLKMPAFYYSTKI